MTSRTSNRSAKVAKKATTRRAPAKAAKPRKASGKSSGPGVASKRIEKQIAELGDWRGERLAEIRKLIHDTDAEVIEEWKWLGTPVWSHAGMYVLANPHKGKVKVTFFHGAELPDPKKLFNAGSGGNKWRAIDFREGDRIDQAAFGPCCARRSPTTPRIPYRKAKGPEPKTRVSNPNRQILRLMACRAQRANYAHSLCRRLELRTTSFIGSILLSTGSSRINRNRLSTRT